MTTGNQTAWEKRKARERRRDAISDVAFEIAEHVAGANMIRVERDDADWIHFSQRVYDVPWCECGLPMIPFPQFYARYGCLPLYVCGVCSLDVIIDLARKLDERVSQEDGPVMPTSKSRRKPRAAQLGVTDAEYDRLLAAQGGGCAICGNPPKTRRLHADHDHKTGRVRGLLCHRCNRALPNWVTADWLLRASGYLRGTVSRHPRLHARRKMP